MKDPAEALARGWCSCCTTTPQRDTFYHLRLLLEGLLAQSPDMVLLLVSSLAAALSLARLAALCAMYPVLRRAWPEMTGRLCRSRDRAELDPERRAAELLLL